MTRGGRICFFSSLRNNRLAACLSRRRWCWLLNEEPVGLFAAASVMVDPAIGEAADVDTAVVTLRMKSGALCQIANTRRAIYGYD